MAFIHGRDALTEMDPRVLTSYAEVDEIFARDYVGAADGYNSSFAKVRPWYSAEEIPDDLVNGFSFVDEDEREARIFADKASEDATLEAEYLEYDRKRDAENLIDFHEDPAWVLMCAHYEKVGDLYAGLGTITTADGQVLLHDGMDDYFDAVDDPNREIVDFDAELAMPSQSGSHHDDKMKKLAGRFSWLFRKENCYRRGFGHGMRGRFKKRFPWSKKAEIRRSNDEWLRQHPAGGSYLESWSWFGDYPDPLLSLGGELVKTCGSNAEYYGRLLSANCITPELVEANWSGYGDYPDPTLDPWDYADGSGPWDMDDDWSMQEAA